MSGGREEARPETTGGVCTLAIPGLDPGIPAGMTAQWVLPWVLIKPGGTISSRGCGIQIKPSPVLFDEAAGFLESVCRSPQPVSCPVEFTKLVGLEVDILP